MSDSLLAAIGDGDVEQALAALREHPEAADARDDAGVSALMLALYRGQTDVAEAVRAARGDVDVFEAAALGDADTVHRLVEEDPSRVAAWSPDGFTPLHYAAFFGHAEATRVLITAGADLEAASRNTQFAPEARPLHSAAAARAVEVCAVLLEAGADPNARQHGGFTPLLEAAQNPDSELADLLLRRGADPSLTLADGRSAAELAEAAGDDELARRLRPA